MRIVTGTMMVTLALGLSAGDATPSPQRWIQGKVAFIASEGCNCIQDSIGLGAGAGAWLTPRWGAEFEYLQLPLKSRAGDISVNEQEASFSGLFNLKPAATSWVPYLHAGLGMARVPSPWSLTLNATERPTLSGGLGVQRFFGRQGMASLDLRSVTINTASRRYEYQALLGFGFRLGVPAAIPEAPIALAGTPAPVLEPFTLDTRKEAALLLPEPLQVEAVPPPAPAPAAEPKAPSPSLIVLDDATLHFDNDRADISPKGRDAIRRVAGSLKRYPGAFDLTITGHTSNLGSAAHNLVLSRHRADAVGRLLVAAGIPARKIRCVGMGAEHPIVSNLTLEGQNRNRRVEIEITAKDVETRHLVVFD